MNPHALSTNGRIAAALIDVLVASSDRAAARRAVQAAGGDEAVRAREDWLPEETLGAMFSAAAGDARLPQRVGRNLVCSPQAGFFLRYGGVATPEKAYRRCDQILAREARGALYEVAEVARGRARVLFHPAEGASPEPVYCALRQGMLEAIPSVYGLLPARVRETECVRRGAAHCAYDVRWSRSSRRGLVVGGLAGVVSGVAFAALAGVPLWGVPIAAFGAGLVVAAAGRSFDLAWQLDAVAGARRGQLALLDQVDQSLAEKMDQLARLDAAGGSGSDARGPQFAELRGAEVETAALGARAAIELQPVDLVAVVRRAVDRAAAALSDSQQTQLAPRPQIQLQLPDDPMWLDGEPMQLEELIVALIRVAAAAAPAEEESGGAGAQSIRVSLQVSGDRLELTVEDDGCGIQPEAVDEVFDPFVTGAARSGPRGLGLATAYRVVKEHGGELRLESTEGRGTRITALLPRPTGDRA